MIPPPPDRLRAIPAVEAVLRHPALDPLRNSFDHKALVRLVRAVLADVRHEILDRSGEGRPGEVLSEEVLAARVVAEASALLSLGPTSVINATGIVLHTNLGRAPLSEGALEAVVTAARGYSNLEYDLPRGARGSRMTHVERLIRFLAGAEAGMAVNNNAAAVLLALNSLAEGREVLVSRGELVEIGGSFRIPEIMKKSGARLVEVGTTNKTHRRDFERAITKETALILKVHASNYRIEGFTSEVSLVELAEIGEARGVPVMVDLGSGALVDMTQGGTPAEPLVAECLAAGADLVTFSGDKLLGGPQAGLVAGRAELVRTLRENPLARAVRLDKMSLAALAATLVEFLHPDNAWSRVPALAMIRRDIPSLEKGAQELARLLKEACGSRLSATVAESTGEAGGGALPLAGLPTRVVQVTVTGLSPDRLETRLRNGTPPVIARIEKDRVLFDLRTLSASELELLPGLVCRAIES